MDVSRTGREAGRELPLNADRHGVVVRRLERSGDRNLIAIVRAQVLAQISRPGREIDGDERQPQSGEESVHSCQELSRRHPRERLHVVGRH